MSHTSLLLVGCSNNVSILQFLRYYLCPVCSVTILAVYATACDLQTSFSFDTTVKIKAMNAL